MKQPASCFRGSGVDLAGDEEDRNGIKMRDRKTGGRIGHTRSRRDAAHSDFSCRSCITVSHQGRGLFVAHEDVLDLRVAIKSVVNRHGMGTRNPEHRVDAVPDERLHNELAASHICSSPRKIDIATKKHKTENILFILCFFVAIPVRAGGIFCYQKKRGTIWLNMRRIAANFLSARLLAPEPLPEQNLRPARMRRRRQLLQLPCTPPETTTAPSLIMMTPPQLRPSPNA